MSHPLITKRLCPNPECKFGPGEKPAEYNDWSKITFEREDLCPGCRKTNEVPAAWADGSDETYEEDY